jgi:hypothetical protein
MIESFSINAIFGAFPLKHSASQVSLSGWIYRTKWALARKNLSEAFPLNEKQEIQILSTCMSKFMRFQLLRSEKQEIQILSTCMSVFIQCLSFNSFLLFPFDFKSINMFPKWKVFQCTSRRDRGLGSFKRCCFIQIMRRLERKSSPLLPPQHV